MKSLKVTMLLTLAVFLPLFLGGCGIKEVSEEEALNAMNAYLLKEDTDMSATDVVIGEHELEDDYEYLRCDITLKGELGDDYAAVSMPASMVFHHDEDGWQLNEVKSRGDKWSWIHYPDAESLIPIISDSLSIPIEDGCLSVDEKNTEEDDLSYNEIFYNYSYNYTGYQNADITGTVSCSLGFHDDTCQVGTNSSHDDFQAKWKLDGTWKASWESEEFGEKTILITIEGEKVTDLCVTDSKGNKYGHWGADKLTFNHSSYPYSDYTEDMTKELFFHIYRGNSILSPSEGYNIYFSLDGAYLEWDQDTSISKVVSDLVRQTDQNRTETDTSADVATTETSSDKAVASGPVSLLSIEPFYKGTGMKTFEDTKVVDSQGEAHFSGLRGYCDIGDFDDNYFLWKLNREYSKLTATGIVSASDLASKNVASYKIYGDDVLLYNKEGLTADTKPYEISVDISGVDILKIEMYGQGNLYSNGIDSYLCDVFLIQ